MKALFALLVILFIGSSYGLTHHNISYISYNAATQTDDPDEPGPGMGNDGEDNSERGMMCRLFGMFCSSN